jgi:hypothetical protein
MKEKRTTGITEKKRVHRGGGEIAGTRQRDIMEGVL